MPKPIRTLTALAAAIILLLLAYTLATTRTSVVFEAPSEFGAVRVTERADGLRRLQTGAGRATQSSIYPGRPLHLEHAYTRVAMIGPALAPDSGRILFVGLGGGAMPMYTRHTMTDADIDVAEIDPVIVDVARDWFGFRADARMRVHTGDGRALIERAPPASWDVIVLDAFSDDEIPFSLTTREFLTAVRTSLAGDGVVISNLWSANALHTPMIATYQAVFDHVHLIDVPRRRQQILVAGTSARPLDCAALTAAADRFDRATDGELRLAALVRDGCDAPTSPANARILTDDDG